jgi:hypothetical protein
LGDDGGGDGARAKRIEVAVAESSFRSTRRPRIAACVPARPDTPPGSVSSRRAGGILRHVLADKRRPACHEALRVPYWHLAMLLAAAEQLCAWEFPDGYHRVP